MICAIRYLYLELTQSIQVVQTPLKVVSVEEWLDACREDWARMAASRSISDNLSAFRVRDSLTYSANLHISSFTKPEHRWIFDAIRDICCETSITRLRSEVERLVGPRPHGMLRINGWQDYRTGLTIPATMSLRSIYWKIKDLPTNSYWTLTQKRSLGITIVHAWRQFKIAHHFDSDDSSEDGDSDTDSDIDNNIQAFVREHQSEEHKYSGGTEYAQNFTASQRKTIFRKHHVTNKKRRMAFELFNIVGNDRYTIDGDVAFNDFKRFVKWATPYYDIVEAFGGHGILLVLPEGCADKITRVTKWHRLDFVRLILGHCPDLFEYVRLLTDNVLVPALAGEIDQLRRLRLMTRAVNIKKKTLIDLVTIRAS
jgi:hypothetical protein